MNHPIPNPRVVRQFVANRSRKLIDGDWQDGHFHCTASIEYDDGGPTLWMEIEAWRDEGQWHWVRTDIEAITYPIHGDAIEIRDIFESCPGGEKFLTEWIVADMESEYEAWLEMRSEREVG